MDWFTFTAILTGINNTLPTMVPEKQKIGYKSQHETTRLQKFGHVERSSGAVRTACDIQIDGRQGAGKPKLTCKKLT